MKGWNYTTAFALLFLCSCSLLNDEITSPKLYGEWEWIESTGGFAGWTITPDSAGVPERTLVFREDHTFLHYRADTLFRKDDFLLTIKNGDVFISYEEMNDEKKGYIPDQWVRFQSKDTLQLMDECFDCYIHVYARVK